MYKDLVQKNSREKDKPIVILNIDSPCILTLEQTFPRHSEEREINKKFISYITFVVSYNSLH